MSVWVVVVAAGAASRFGVAKQFGTLGGRRVLDWSLEAVASVADGVVLVVPASRIDRAEPAADRVVAGGATRSASVRCGLAAVPDDAEVIVVHDAARPLAAADLFVRSVAAVAAGADGAICAVANADTLKRVEAGVVVETVDREGLWAVQTPQAFRASVLRQAHRCGGEASDDAALVEAAGGRVVVVEGDVRNLKLTRPGDLVVAEALVATLGR
ncbi:MAG: 2-C-methyl-D-erythritol 4-phosphate cytidylyltransferase [Acidimicrobiales bacterium]